jgi:hypothetical protein
MGFSFRNAERRQANVRHTSVCRWMRKTQVTSQLNRPASQRQNEDLLPNSINPKSRPHEPAIVYTEGVGQLQPRVGFEPWD